MLEWLKKNHPGTTILHLTNDDIIGEVRERISEICVCCSVANLELKGIRKENGHPNRLGMRQIREQLEGWEAFREFCRGV